MTNTFLDKVSKTGGAFVEEEVEDGEVGGEAVEAVAENLVPGLYRDVRHRKFGMDGVAVVIGSGAGDGEGGGGGEDGPDACLGGAPLREAHV